MISGFAVFSVTDLFSKILTSDFHPVQIAWTRQVGVIVGVMLLLAFKGRKILKSTAPGLQIVRGGCAVISATCFIFAISYVPLHRPVAHN